MSAPGIGKRKAEGVAVSPVQVTWRPLSGVTVAAWVVKRRAIFGRVEYLVSPHAGTGAVWVGIDRLDFDQGEKAP